MPVVGHQAEAEDFDFRFLLAVEQEQLANAW